VAPAAGQAPAPLGPWLDDLAPALAASSIELLPGIAAGDETIVTEDGRHALIVELGEAPAKG
jgi:hypothetical protein